MSEPRDPPPSSNVPSAPLQIEMHTQGQTVVVRLSGMAVAEIAGQLSRALQEAAQRKPRLLAVDLSELSFISSTGLGGIIAAHVTCQKNGTCLALIRPRPFIQEILDITKLSDLLKICDTLEEAQQLV